MGARTAVGTAVFVAMLAVLALRPVFSNPATTAILDGGLSRMDWLSLLALAVPAVVLFSLRVLAYAGESDDGQHVGISSRPDPSPTEHADDTDADRHTDTTAMLGGQGGARDSDFEIENEPPETPLSDHFEYLDDQLDETDERPAVEELDPEGLDESPIPDRCPQEYCDAVWTERTVLGFGGERYEVLEDGESVRCLECEQVSYLAE